MSEESKHIFDELIEKKYKEMKTNGLTKSQLGVPELGNLLIFIGNEPSFVVHEVKINDDVVYVGY